MHTILSGLRSLFAPSHVAELFKRRASQHKLFSLHGSRTCDSCTRRIPGNQSHCRACIALMPRGR